MNIVLIDDDILVSKIWMMKAKKFNVTLNYFEKPTDFIKIHTEYEKSSIIVIDKNFPNGECGLKFSEKFFLLGFEKIIISTGDQLDFSEYPWILRKISKDFNHLIDLF